MALQVDSVVNGECFGYPLVRLVGRAGDANGSGSVTVTVGGESSKWPVVKGKFKALALLRAGENTVNLQLDGTGLSSSLQLTYDPKRFDNNYVVKLIYWVAKGEEGRFRAPAGVPNDQESGKNRLRTAALLMQTFCAENLKYYGLGSFTFTLEMEEDGNSNRPKVHVVECPYTRDEMRANWAKEGDGFAHRQMGEDARHLLSDDTRKGIGLITVTEYDKNTRKSVMHCALGGGRLGIFGTGALHTWATDYKNVPDAFLDNGKIDTSEFQDDSIGRCTRWANFATGMGATLHEIGHAFGLPHVDLRCTGNCVMSRGYDWINRYFVEKEVGRDQPTGVGEESGVTWCRGNAVWLRFSPFFNRKRLEPDQMAADLPAITPRTVPEPTATPCDVTSFVRNGFGGGYTRLPGVTLDGSQCWVDYAHDGTVIAAYRESSRTSSHVLLAGPNPAPCLRLSSTCAQRKDPTLQDWDTICDGCPHNTHMFRNGALPLVGEAFELANHSGGFVRLPGVFGGSGVWMEYGPNGAQVQLFNEVLHDTEDGSIVLTAYNRLSVVKLTREFACRSTDGGQDWSDMSEGRLISDLSGSANDHVMCLFSDSSAWEPLDMDAGQPLPFYRAGAPTGRALPGPSGRSLGRRRSEEFAAIIAQTPRTLSNRVHYNMNNGGSFELIHEGSSSVPRTWFEIGSDKMHHCTFVEVKRDGGPTGDVLLFDGGRNMSLKLSAGGVYWSDNGGQSWNLLSGGKWADSEANPTPWLSKMPPVCKLMRSVNFTRLETPSPVARVAPTSTSAPTPTIPVDNRMVKSMALYAMGNGGKLRLAEERQGGGHVWWEYGGDGSHICTFVEQRRGGGDDGKDVVLYDQGRGMTLKLTSGGAYWSGNGGQQWNLLSNGSWSDPQPDSRNYTEDIAGTYSAPHMQPAGENTLETVGPDGSIHIRSCTGLPIAFVTFFSEKRGELFWHVEYGAHAVGRRECLECVIPVQSVWNAFSARHTGMGEPQVELGKVLVKVGDVAGNSVGITI